MDGGDQNKKELNMTTLARLMCGKMNIHYFCKYCYNFDALQNMRDEINSVIQECFHGIVKNQLQSRYWPSGNDYDKKGEWLDIETT